MSIGFIMYEIVDKDSLKYQGINTDVIIATQHVLVGYSLKNQGINTDQLASTEIRDVGYSLKNQGINTV